MHKTMETEIKITVSYDINTSEYSYSTATSSSVVSYRSNSHNNPCCLSVPAKKWAPLIKSASITPMYSGIKLQSVLQDVLLLYCDC